MYIILYLYLFHQIHQETVITYCANVIGRIALSDFEVDNKLIARFRISRNRELGIPANLEDTIRPALPSM